MEKEVNMPLIGCNVVANDKRNGYRFRWKDTLTAGDNVTIEFSGMNDVGC